MRLESPKWESILFGILAFFFLLHILASSAIVFSPEVREVLEGISITGYYKSYTALGSFFRAENVRSTYNLGFSYKSIQGSDWFNPVNDNHQKYLTSGSYVRLKRAEFEKYLAGLVYSEQDKNDKRNQDFVFEYLKHEYLNNRSIDSLNVVVLRMSQRQGTLQTDTIRKIQYQVHHQ